MTAGGTGRGVGSGGGAAAFTRVASLARLEEETFDVLVIGGGITGAGVALDASARGLRTALVEGADLGSGTSSRSSKLVHGGLRYLAQREYGLVAQALAERRRLLANAPHLVRPLAFLLPVYGHGLRAATTARSVDAGLWLYDLAGGARAGHVHHRRPPAAALARCPALRGEGLRVAFEFLDACADDARLTLAVARTAAVDHGCAVLNHATVTGLLKDASGRVHGACVRAGLDGGRRDVEVRADAVVNATGVWAGEVAALDDAGSAPALRPARGVHLAVPADRVPGEVALVVAAGDGRSVFVVPWAGTGRVYIGTTDVDHQGPLVEPAPTADEASYLLEAANRVLSEPLVLSDVVGAWAGLRPLVARGEGGGPVASADLSRRHQLVRSPGGVWSVTGGKLTTYRRMAADTVDAVVSWLGRGHRRCPTARLPLRGSGPVSGSPPPDVSATAWHHLLARYGSETGNLTAMLRSRPELAQPLVPTLPYLAVEAVYAARYEMAATLDDVLARRTRCLPLDAVASAEAAEDVAGLVGDELGWDGPTRRQEASSFRDLARAQLAGIHP